MKAAVIHEFGDVDVLKYEEIPTPRPRPGHILIKVLAGGVNRLDHYLREGTVSREDSLSPHTWLRCGGRGGRTGPRGHRL